MKRLVQALAVTIVAAGTFSPLGAQSFGNAITVGEDQIFVGEPTYKMRSGVV